MSGMIDTGESVDEEAGVPCADVTSALMQKTMEMRIRRKFIFATVVVKIVN
jgi:hypothetical protein